MNVRVRVRGIYATALTRLLCRDGFDIVQLSAPIEERFETGPALDEYDAAIEATSDRQGVGIHGDPEVVADLGERFSGVGIDAFAWTDAAPREAVFDCVVRETRKDGAVVDLGPCEAFLPYAAIDGYVDAGDRYRVQVTDPAPPWSDDRSVVDAGFAVGGGLLTLVRDESAGDRTATGPGMGAALVDLLEGSPPAEWRARWSDRSVDADLDALEDALSWAAERAEALDGALADADGAGSPPGEVWSGLSSAWVWFGRSSRFALDGHRRAVTPTLPGHHRIKAGTEDASAAVDFAEAVCGSSFGTDGIEAGGDGATDADGDTSADDDPTADDEAFPFAVVTRHFGPTAGDEVMIGHGKPTGRLITLGRGEVIDRDPAGTISIRREMTPGGNYDALGVERRAGDVALTRFEEGRWWYQTVYRGADGERRGTYVNVCTPLEVFPETVRYVDLYVDIVRHADGRVERVDDDELDAAVDDGLLSEALARTARSVATAIETGL